RDEGLEGDPVKVVELTAKRFGMTEDEGKSVLRYLIQGGDLSRFGLFNAVTRTAEDLESYDRATEFERFGGEIVELKRNEWAELQEAAPQLWNGGRPAAISASTRTCVPGFAIPEAVVSAAPVSPRFD